MNHVPPPDVGAVWVIGALYEFASFPVQDASAIWIVGLPPFPVTLHHLLRTARTTLQTRQIRVTSSAEMLTRSSKVSLPRESLSLIASWKGID